MDTGPYCGFYPLQRSSRNHSRSDAGRAVCTDVMVKKHLLSSMKVSDVGAEWPDRIVCAISPGDHEIMRRPYLQVPPQYKKKKHNEGLWKSWKMFFVTKSHLSVGGACFNSDHIQSEFVYAEEGRQHFPPSVVILPCDAAGQKGATGWVHASQMTGSGSGRGIREDHKLEIKRVKYRRCLKGACQISNCSEAFREVIASFPAQVHTTDMAWSCDLIMLTLSHAPDNKCVS